VTAFAATANIQTELEHYLCFHTVNMSEDIFNFVLYNCTPLLSVLLHDVVLLCLRKSVAVKCGSCFVACGGWWIKVKHVQFVRCTALML